MITTVIGVSSESADVLRRLLGVDCGTGGGSFIAKKESNGAASPKPNASFPPASPAAGVVLVPQASPPGKSY